VLALAEQTTVESAGYFNIVRADGTIDPSGIVKGWALKKATDLLLSLGYEHFCIDAGGDISVHGVNAVGEPWSVGIRNPFNHDEVVKALYPKTLGVATSGSSARGDHIYNPHEPRQTLRDVVSITVIGPNILEADRFATAAFAMGTHGIDFIESLQGFEAYQIDANGIATMTRGFEHLTHA
jgi:thiamine biosynthesis lipoprotein